MAIVMTERELRILKEEKERLERRKNYSHMINYGIGAYNNDLSLSEYKQITEEIENIERKIKDAVIIPSIKIGTKFVVERNGERLNMKITVNPVDIPETICCTCDSLVGSCLLYKTVNDTVVINEVTYKVISIEE